MKLKDLKEDIEKGNFIYRGLCHDCRTHVEVTAKLTEEGAIEIDGGSVYKVKERNEEKYFFKCDTCFKANPRLTDFVDTLVYSRVVGYLRPVSGYNKGKLEEFKMRKLFKNTKGL